MLDHILFIYLFQTVIYYSIFVCCVVIGYENDWIILFLTTFLKKELNNRIKFKIFTFGYLFLSRQR